MSPKAPQSAAAAERERRRNAVALLLKSGWSQERIAEELRRRGIQTTQRTVSRDIAELRRQWVRENIVAVQEHAATHLAILNDWLAAISDDARAGDRGAITTGLAILDRQAAILGYREAHKVWISGPYDGPVEVASSDADNAALDHVIRSTPEVRDRIRALLSDVGTRALEAGLIAAPLPEALPT